MADETNLDDILAEELKNIQDRDTPQIDAPESVDEAIIEEPDSDETRSRDEKGRFKPKEPDDEASEEEPEEDEGVEAELDTDTGEPVDELPEVEEPEETDPKLKTPPSTWRPQAKAKWNELPPDIREEIQKREQDSMNGVNQMREKANFGDRMQQIVHPYTPMIQAQGSTPERVVQGMLNTAYVLTSGTPEQKAQAIAQTAQQFGVDLALLKQNDDPQQAAVQSTIQPYIGKISQLEQQLNTLLTQNEQATTVTAQQQINDFSTAADETGNLKYPYFENVRTQMAIAIDAAEQQGETLSLEKAYEAAVWANPDTRALMMSAQTKSSDAQRQAQAKEKAARAQKAGKVNLRKSSGYESKQPQPTGSLEDTLTETLENVKKSA